jgi:hypothetical protein
VSVKEWLCPPTKAEAAATLFWWCLMLEYDSDLTAREWDELRKRIDTTFMWFGLKFFPLEVAWKFDFKVPRGPWCRLN